MVFLLVTLPWSSCTAHLGQVMDPENGMKVGPSIPATVQDLGRQLGLCPADRAALPVPLVWLVDLMPSSQDRGTGCDCAARATSAGIHEEAEKTACPIA